MKTLYIIGNGFDCAHSMPVCYKCFKHYLESNNGQNAECVCCMYYKQKQCTKKDCYLLSLLNTAITDKENWSDFEEALAKLDFTVLVDVCSYKSFDQLIDNFSACLQEAFHSWINHIVVPPSECCKFKFDTSAYFVTFNYTMTLEQMYNIESSKIYHIHCSTNGQQSNGEKYVFGHSSDCNQIKNCMTSLKTKVQDNVLEEWCEELARLKKETFTIQRELSALLQQADLENPQIKIIGHSFGRVDYDYFGIMRELFPKAKWTYYYHNAEGLCGAQNNVNLFMKEKGVIDITYKPQTEIRNYTNQ